MSAFTTARKYGSKAVAAAGALMLSAAAFAQEGPIDTMLGAVGLDGIGVKLTAMGVIIVGIALIYKGPVLAKRIIAKV